MKKIKLHKIANKLLMTIFILFVIIENPSLSAIATKTESKSATSRSINIKDKSTSSPTKNNQQNEVVVTLLKKIQSQLEKIEKSNQQQKKDLSNIFSAHQKLEEKVLKLSNKIEKTGSNNSLNEKINVKNKKSEQKNQIDTVKITNPPEIDRKNDEQNSISDTFTSTNTSKSTGDDHIDIYNSPQYLESRASNSDSPQMKGSFVKKITAKEKTDGLTEYQNAYQLLREANGTNKDFSAAMSAMEKFVKKYPNHPLTGNAYYWMGEIHIYNKQYEKAALQYLKGYSSQKGERSVFNLIGLARSYNKIGKKDDVCSTIMHLQKEFPNADNVIKNEAKELIRDSGC